MDPPSYEEATLHQPLPATYPVPSEAPPSYEETRNVPSGPVPTLRTPAITPTQTSQVFVHQPSVVSVQPDPVHILRSANQTSQVVIHQTTGGPVHPGSISTLSSPTMTTTQTSHVSFQQPNVVRMQPHAFPVLERPTVTSTTQTSRVFVHHPTVVGTGQHQRQQTRAAAQVVTSQPRKVTVPVSQLRNQPGYVRCPECHQEVTTNKVLIPTTTAFIICTTILLSCLFCGFCLIPFCIPSCWNVHHYCPLCKKRLHIFVRMQQF